MSDPENRLQELEMKVAFLEETLDDLNRGLVEEALRGSRLEGEIVVLKEALRRLSNKDAGQEILGAIPEEDPVPNSG
jgi:uncharacterized coiled-coil protein SlyX